MKTARINDSMAGVDVAANRRVMSCVRDRGDCGCVVVVAVGSTHTSSTVECMRNS